MSIASRIESMTEHLTNDWNIIDNLGLHTKKLPKEYTQVDYIESSGTQYIDTGVNTDYRLSVITELSVSSVGGSFGAISGTDPYIRYYFNFASGQGVRLYYSNSKYAQLMLSTDTINNKHKYLIDMYNKKVRVDEGENIDLEYNTNFDTGLKYWIFRRNADTDNLKVYTNTKIYSFQMYYGNELVRDFIPCYRNSDNEVGLYDIVNNVFYTNQGTGVFTYGQIQEEHIDKNIENIKEPLNLFYNEVSDKTDLSQNGVVGRTSQETTSGINVYNVNSHYVLSDGYSINDEDWLTNTYDNSQGVEHYENIWCRATSLLETSTNYLIVCEIKSVSGSGILYPYTKHSTSAIDTQHSSYSFSSLSPGQKILIPVTTKSSFSGLSCDLRTLVRYNEGQSGSITFRLSLLTNTSITSDTFVYEPFTNGPSPNPDYPQPINNLSGNVPYKVSGKNLFNENYYSDKTKYKKSGIYFAFAELPDTFKTKFYVNMSVKGTNQNLVFGFIDTMSGVFTDGIRVLNNGTLNSNVECDFTNAEHVYIGIGNGSKIDTNTDIARIFDNYNIIVSTTSGEQYEPYIEPRTFNIPLKSKNLFDKNTTNKLNGFFERSGDTIHSSGVNRVFYLECKPNTTYAFTQGETNISNHVFQVASTIEKPDINVAVENFVDRSGYNPYKTFTYTTNANAKYLVIRLRSSDTTNEFLDGVQIEENNEVTPYEPYYNIELCNIDTYEDKIYSSNGRFYLKKNIAKLTFNGSETWNKSNITGSVLTQRFRTTQSITMISNLAICDKFINRSSGISAGDYECFLVTNNTSTYISININRLTENTVQAFETWLSNNNVTTYVVLATPTTTEITQENYPALYNALKQIQDYLTAYKINKEFILGYSSPEIEY